MNVTMSWAVILDVAAIVSCWVLIGFLVWNRVRYRRWLMPDAPAVSFGSELDSEMLRQRAGRAHEAVVRVLEEELDLLVEECVSGPAPQQGFRWSPEAEGFQSDVMHPPENGAVSSEAEGNYQLAYQMAAKGANAEMIRARTGLTAGEAELICNLQEYRTAS
ncbi:MAG: DUF2802 domain-containing protein [Desulfobacterales bacterium]